MLLSSLYKNKVLHRHVFIVCIPAQQTNINVLGILATQPRFKQLDNLRIPICGMAKTRYTRDHEGLYFSLSLPTICGDRKYVC